MPSPTRVALALLLTSTALAQPDPGAPPQAIDAWRARRFGMFIHWGPVALTGREIGWSRGRPTPIDEYDHLYQRFNPTAFDADDWAALADDAGAHYVVLTTKHHDGFCLWPSDSTDYDIASSPFHRDPVAELAAACRAQGLAFGAYYSVPDWHHPDYPKGSPHGETDKPDPQPDRYADYLRNQVTELTTRYGPLCTLWFDMPREFGPDQGLPTVAMLRKLQPDIVINDRAFTPDSTTTTVGDYATPEQRIGGFDRSRPWESCITIGTQWSWKPDDTIKTVDECVRTLLTAIGGDGNLLLNVGPMPDGRIEPRQADTLRALGAWVHAHEQAIYDTRGGPFKPGPWGASTCREHTINLFAFRWPEDGALRLPPIQPRVLRARLADGRDVAFEQSDDALALTVPPSDRDPIATMIALTLDSNALAITPLDVPRPASASVAFAKPATASNIFQNSPQYAPAKALDDDPETRWATDAGTHSAWLEIDLGAPIQIGSIMIDEPAQYQRIRAFAIECERNGRWTVIHEGSTIGPRWTHTLAPVTSQRFRLRIDHATEGPTIAELQLLAPNP